MILLNEFLLKSATKSTYKYFPKDRVELRKCINEEFAKGNYDLNCIRTNDITDMSSLFSLNVNPLPEDKLKLIDISKWNTSNVKDMSFMFAKFMNLNCDISKWDVSKVEVMKSMFLYCKNFNQDLSKWNVSNVKYMNNMFSGCENFNQDLSNWKVDNVVYFDNMFYNCKKFNQDLSNWKINSDNHNHMFSGSGMKSEYKPNFKNE